MEFSDEMHKKKRVKRVAKNEKETIQMNKNCPVVTCYFLPN